MYLTPTVTSSSLLMNALKQKYTRNQNFRARIHRDRNTDSDNVARWAIHWHAFPLWISGNESEIDSFFTEKNQIATTDLSSVWCASLVWMAFTDIKWGQSLIRVLFIIVGGGLATRARLIGDTVEGYGRGGSDKALHIVSTKPFFSKRNSWWFKGSYVRSISVHKY